MAKPQAAPSDRILQLIRVLVAHDVFAEFERNGAWASEQLRSPNSRSGVMLLTIYQPLGRFSLLPGRMYSVPSIDGQPTDW
jgi:hypothetical protein